MSSETPRKRSDIKGFVRDKVARLFSSGEDQIQPGETDQSIITRCPDFERGNCAYSSEITGALKPNCARCYLSDERMDDIATDVVHEFERRGRTPIKRIPVRNPDDSTLNGIEIVTPLERVVVTQGFGGLVTLPRDEATNEPENSLLVWGSISAQVERTDFSGPMIAERRRPVTTPPPQEEPEIDPKTERRAKRKINAARESGAGGVLHRPSLLERRVKRLLDKD